MPNVDELFKLSTNNGKAETVVMLDPNKISDFPNHPFRIENNEEMEKMIESIRQIGVKLPVLVRPKKDGNYEMVSGHRRNFAAKKAGLNEIPAIIREMTDEEAIVIMVDSNIQREKILISEKAFAYKMKYEAIKRKAGRRKCGQVDHNLGKKSIELIGEECGDSPKQVQRYIKITELIPEMLEKVDDGSMGFTPAVQLSFLKKN